MSGEMSGEMYRHEIYQASRRHIVIIPA